MSMVQELVLYLRLTPEFGGTRFGFFEGIEVVLGSDGSRCDITLPQSLGVLPIHVRVMRQADNSMILAPAERTATVFLWKQTARTPVQVDTPTAVRAGDSFALVTENGPRFVIELDELPQEVKDARDKKPSIRDKRLNAGAFGKEAKRQAFTRVLVTGPGQFVQRAWTFVKSGAIFQPRYIFLGVTMLAGYVWAGGMTCKGKKTAKLLESESVKLDNCEKTLGFTSERGEDASWTFPQLVAEVLGVDGGVGLALEEDTKLRDAVWEQSKIILSQTKQYTWLLESRGGKASEFADFRERLLAEEDLDTELIKVLPYLAADPSRHASEWDKMEDSLTEDVCTRGVAKLTYRQALHLGLAPMLDAMIPASKMSTYMNDKQLHEQALRATLDGAGQSEFPESFDTTVDEFTKGQGGCLYVVGDDDRARPPKVVNKLVRHLGAEADFVPLPEASPHATSARLAKLFTADLPEVDYRAAGTGAVSFSEFPVSTVTAGLESKGDWVLQQTARVIARAVVLPCQAAVDPKVDKEKAAATMGELPPLTQCLMLDWRLRSDSQ
jgi:hypothetical protein